MATVTKVYPIEGRKDFFKYTILKKGESIFNKDAKLHTDFQGKEMYFDDKEQADYVCKAINKVARINKDFINS